MIDEIGYDRLTADRATDLLAAAFGERGLDLDRVGEVSVALVGPETIKALNAQFRNKDAETDVLSFEVDGPYGEMVGEVVICPACADMPVEELVVHGALHLAGLDHGEDFGASEMAEVQRTVMERTGG